ncbi:hypothetical protein BDZ45DRAFT_159488 [Acephala macrosclerotiorum]|nr:hypothetical protein BDZ45DRAFT_159488 [Acephala macrosclerotiorum]
MVDYPDKEYLEYRELEVASSNSRLATCDTLYLKYGITMPCITFVSTKVYFVGLEGLVRFRGASPNFRKISNLDLLLDRIEDTEPHFYEPHDPRWHPAYRGGRVGQNPLKLEAEEATRPTSTSPMR